VKMIKEIRMNLIRLFNIKGGYGMLGIWPLRIA
jgi:hypothetical protein